MFHRGDFGASGEPGGGNLSAVFSVIFDLYPYG
jgi:hypothetical protein